MREWSQGKSKEDRILREGRSNGSGGGRRGEEPLDASYVCRFFSLAVSASSCAGLRVRPGKETRGSCPLKNLNFLEGFSKAFFPRGGL